MALSGIQLSAGIVVGSNTSVDAKYGPYADVATAKSEIGSTLRYKGLTVGILSGSAVVEYWWESGTADGDLVLKTVDISGKLDKYDGTTYDINALACVTQAEYDALTPSSTTIYFIV